MDEETQIAESHDLDSYIALLKLISGEEIISECINDGEFYVLRRPRKVFLAQMPDGSAGIRLMPLILGNPDGVFPVHSGHVMTVSHDVMDKLLNGYKSEVSGLDLSQTNSSKIVL
jgi:hypothetical protein